jgi:hypothetical protein
MSEPLILWKDNLAPSVGYTVTIAGQPVNLTGATVKFRMRQIGSQAYVVDTDVVVTDAANGVVRWDPVSADVDESNQYLGWFQVTYSNTKTQDTPEFLVLIRAHTPISNTYVEIEELKSSTELTGTSFADMDLQNALVAASRTVDSATGRRFYPDIADQTRFYTANGLETIRIDDLVSLTSVETDINDDGTFEYLWTLDTDFVLEPRNAELDGLPFNEIRRLTAGIYGWPLYPDAIKVTGRFGWATPPEAIKVATTILAARYVKRMREAPFGIAGFDGTGLAVRISSTDPDVAQLLAPYTIRTLFV